MVARWPRIVPALVGLLAACTGCTQAPDGVAPVRDFDLERYLGRWYEIARLDHRFERGLRDVSAEYARDPNGTITVVNRGRDAETGEWKSIRGRAKPAGAMDVGALRVSFFGPFYGGYNIIALDHDGYEWALVCGPSRSYLWILARTPPLDPAVTARLRREAARLGFPAENLIMVPHGDD